MTNQLTYDQWHVTPTLPPIPLTDVWSPRGTHLARIEHYVNISPDRWEALVQYQNRSQTLLSDLSYYATVVVDSLSTLQDAAVQYHRIFTPYTALGNIDPRKWYANAKESVQQELIARLAWIRHQNLVVIAHDSEKVMEFGDEVVRSVDAIGKLARSIGRIFGEVYHTAVQDELDAKGRPTGHSRYFLQTRTDSKWGAITLINAPNFCEASWDRLWDGGHAVKTIRAIVYGGFGTGKSKFASTFPTPMLVLGFDPFDKLVHYENIEERGADAT